MMGGRALFLKKVIMVIMMTVAFSQYSHAQIPANLKYKFVKNDQIGKVLNSLAICPLWGRSKSVAKVFQMNPHLAKGDHSISPGAIVELPIEAANLPDHPAIEEKDGFVSLNPNVPRPSFCKTRSQVALNDRSSQRDISADESPLKDALPSSFIVNEDDLVSQSFSVGLGAGFFRVDGVDPHTNGKLVVLSNLAPSGNLGWTVDWSKTTSFSVTGQVQKYTLQPLKDSQSFDKSQGTRSSMSISGMHRLTSNFSLGAAFNFNEELFFHSKSSTVLAVDKILIASPMLKARLAIKKKANAEAGLLAETGLLMPAKGSSYNIKSGLHMLGGLYLRPQSLNRQRGVEGQIFYSYDKQDTSLTKRMNTELGVKVFYFWGFDW